MTGWKSLCAVLVFVAISTTLASVLGVASGRVTTLHAWAGFAAGLVAARTTWKTASAPRQKIGRMDYLMFAIFGIAALRAFLWVIYINKDDINVLSPHNLGDMSLHLNLIRGWAGGGSFWPDNPFLTGAIFPYHAGMDLWNALLTLVGIPVMEGLRWTGLIASIATAAALWRWGREFAMAAFLFAGGFAALALLGGASLTDMEENIAWKNLFLAMFVTQRGLLYSLPAGLVLMCIWRARLSGDHDGPQLGRPAEVALYATMPLFNAPAFIFLSVLLAASFIVGRANQTSRSFFSIAAWSLLPATWLVALVTVHFTAPSAFRWEPGWMHDNGGVWFWLRNFGILPLMLVALGFIVWRKRGDVTARLFYTVGMGCLVFCLLFAVAPWAWDNTKWMIWGYLAVMPLLWTELIRHWHPAWRMLAVVTLFSSGAISLVNGLGPRHGYKLVNRMELAETEVMLQSVPQDARIACFPTYNHPVLLTGQPVVMGYDGHLFSQGLAYQHVQRDLNELMSGGPDWRAAAERLGCKYILWGPREEYEWPSSFRPWIDEATVIATSETAGTLYRIASK